MSGDEDDGRTEFERLLGQVDRKSDRSKLRREPSAAPRARATGGAASFEQERAGEQRAGWVSGIDRRRLRALAEGGIPAEREVDLHGLRAAEAERALRQALQTALAAGERCLRVVHGRGLRSEAGPVLKDALPRWLAAAPHGASILAFTTVAPALGGTGATHVLLRRQRGG